jgi:hypothetical protein
MTLTAAARIDDGEEATVGSAALPVRRAKPRGINERSEER